MGNFIGKLSSKIPFLLSFFLLSPCATILLKLVHTKSLLALSLCSGWQGPLLKQAPLKFGVPARWRATPLVLAINIDDTYTDPSRKEWLEGTPVFLR